MGPVGLPNTMTPSTISLPKRGGQTRRLRTKPGSQAHLPATQKKQILHILTALVVMIPQLL